MASASPVPTSTAMPTVTQPKYFFPSTTNIALRRTSNSGSLKSHSYRRAFIAAAAREDASAAAAKEDARGPAAKLDRRELLLAGGAATLSSGGAAFAAPVGDPNLKTCGPSNVQTGPPGNVKELFIACCPPKAKRAPIDFKPDTGPMRTRPAAHQVDEEYISKYNRAYALMRALPANDPRSMYQQANVHCAYCNFAYRQDGDNKSKLQIHHSWLFLPWHRFYLHFHEKILGSLINDPTFALPFWNWDNQEGGSLTPEYFLREDSALFDVNRNPNAYPPSLVNLGIDPGQKEPDRTPEEIKGINLNTMHQNVANVVDQVTFFGGIFRKGDDAVKQNSDGSLEKAPHTAVHIFGGNPKNPFGEDMGNFYSAGKDPLFYAHHGNVDRLWNVWKSLGNGNSDFTDNDYLETEFLFFDENQDLVRCKVKDSLDEVTNMRYKFADVPQDRYWIDYTPPRLSAAASSVGGIGSLVPGGAATAMAAGYPQLSNADITGSPLVVSVPQPKSSSVKPTDEILVLEGLEVPMSSSTNLQVFINLPGADEKTSINCAEYVGSFYNIPHVMPGMSPNQSRTTNGRFSIRKNVELLGLGAASEIVVTVVPKGKDKAQSVKIQSAQIVYT